MNTQRALIGRGVPLVKFRSVARRKSYEQRSTFPVGVGEETHYLSAVSWYRARPDALVVYGPDAKVEPLGGGK
jgi:hypothetical protein